MTPATAARLRELRARLQVRGREWALNQARESERLGHGTADGTADRRAEFKEALVEYHEALDTLAALGVCRIPEEEVLPTMLALVGAGATPDAEPPKPLSAARR